MAVNLSPVFGVAGQVFDDNGNPLAGGKIYTYLAGTTTPAATYTTVAGNITHSNPIILDGAGRVPTGEIWLTDGISYKFVVEDSVGVLIGTYDNLVGINSNFVSFTSQQEIQTATAGQTVFNLTTIQYQPNTNNLTVFVDGVNQYGPGAQYSFVETDSDTITFTSGLHVGALVKFTTASQVSTNATDAANVSYTPGIDSILYPTPISVKTALDNITDTDSGSSYVGFNQGRTNAVDRTVKSRLQDVVSVKDFGAIGDGTADDTVAIQNAVNSIVGTGGVAGVSGSGTIYFPQGTYKITDTITLPQNVFLTVEGAGQRNTLIISFAGGKPIFKYARTSATPGAIFVFRRLIFKLNGNAKTSGSSAIESFGFADGQDDNYLRVYECWFYGFQRAIYAKWTGQARVSDCFFQSNTASIVLLRGASFWYLFQCMSFDDTFLFATDPIADAYSNGLTIDSCANVTAASTNVYIEGWQAVYMWSCGLDLGTGGTAAIWLRSTYDVTIRDTYISSDPTAARNGVFMDNAHSVVIAACQVVNNVVGINVLGAATTATKLVVDSCKFDGQDNNDILFITDVTSSKVTNCHFQKNIPKVGTNAEIYTNTTGTDYNIFTQNTFKSASYTITAAPNSVSTNNIFSVPGTF